MSEIDPKYWEERKDFPYYPEVVRLARKWATKAKSVIDIGNYGCPYLSWFDWIPRKVALDRKVMPSSEGIENITIDFLKYKPETFFDLVLCLQVLEHYSDPVPFCRKLLKTGKWVVISVPYMWPAELDAWHPQDPVDEEKLFSWTGRPAVETSIVGKEMPRLVAVFRRNLQSQ